MDTKKATLSVAIATYNEQEKLDACLASVSGWVDEIVLVDGGSTDRTVAIAKKYNASVVVTDNPAIFHINKQRALDRCTSDWILQLDADEVVSGSLQSEIISVINNPSACAGYKLPRKNYFVGHWLSKGGQYPDYLVRLFRNGKGTFPAKSVHEQIVIDGKIGTLIAPLDHFTYASISQYWRKSDVYTSLTADTIRQQHSRESIALWLQYMVGKPMHTFFSIFLRHKGFMDGYWGLLFAWFSALHFPIAYKKFRHMTHNVHS